MIFYTKLNKNYETIFLHEENTVCIKIDFVGVISLLIILTQADIYKQFKIDFSFNMVVYEIYCLT